MISKGARPPISSPVQPDRAGGRRIAAGDQVEQGRLAGPVRADDRMALAALDGQAQPADDLGPAEALRDSERASAAVIAALPRACSPRPRRLRLGRHARGEPDTAKPERGRDDPGEMRVAVEGHPVKRHLLVPRRRCRQVKDHLDKPGAAEQADRRRNEGLEVGDGQTAHAAAAQGTRASPRARSDRSGKNMTVTTKSEPTIERPEFGLQAQHGLQQGEDDRPDDRAGEESPTPPKKVTSRIEPEVARLRFSSVRIS